MKKFKMVITSLIVLAIVGSAFSFKAKCYTFCVKTGTVAGNCTTFKKDFRITTDPLAANYRYYPVWDGTATLCAFDVNNSCTAQFKLISD